VILKVLSDDTSGVFDVFTPLKAIQVYRGGREWVCGRSLAGVAGSYPAGSMGCVLSSRGLCNSPIPRTGKTYRVCVCVCVNVCEQMKQ
jgi:hypothetical protein